MSTTETITPEPQREATGTAAPRTPTGHSTAYPGGGASETIMAAVVPTLQPGPCVEPHESPVIDPKTGGYAQEIDSPIAVAVPPVAY